MGGRAEPPEGGPEGGAGGEDEFRSVVFDESFIRAARIQELSASERLSGAHRSVRRRGSRGGLPRQALALMLLIGFAFATAVYMGVRHPYAPPITGAAANLTTQVIPLQPGPAGIPTDHNPVNLPPSLVASASASASASAAAGGAPSGGASGSASATPSGSASGASPSASVSAPAVVGHDPVFSGLPGSEYLPIGATGFNLPNARHTDHFTHDQVYAALQVVLNYLKASSLDADVLAAGNTDDVRQYLSPGQTEQFSDSVDHPANDQRHLATGWMVRFDPAKVRLATQQVLVAPGSVAYHELDSGTLEVTSDYTFVYALSPVRPAPATPTAAPSASASGSPSATATAEPVVYYAVRRALTYWLTPDDITGGHLQVVDSVTQAGATSCAADNSAFLQPLFPASGHTGAQPKGSPSASAKATPTPTPHPSGSPSSTPGAVDPFDHSRDAWTVCGQLSWVL
ncbi:SCO2583 family membrane protein [Streptacidiphilus anmyonensis]|uniref:SCO2583 family membrane protein n=1 Tax=Streptacidiphilus anmyonensis TaxID=405782 RepID=UPI000694E56B|nr:hypothetical protein [Streptacidiphilus anmyonensis]